MANKIQLRRDTAANWTRVNPVLDDGEPGLEIDTNKIKYGDGSTAWSGLDYAGGGALPETEGLVTFPGDLLIGTLWPNDPLPGGDKESVIWAKDDTEYLGLWWGGDRIYPDTPYGPVAGIMIGPNDDGSLTDDFVDYGSPMGTSVVIGINDAGGVTKEWKFDNSGILTVPGEIHSQAGIGSVTIQASDGSNPRNFIFNTSGSLSLPALASGQQGAGAFDANNNKLTLNSGDTVDFYNFSGMILVNSHNGGGVTLYLCGGGIGNAVAIGDSKAGNSVGSMASNGGIGGYTFTADESGDHVFCAIRTRTGA